MSYPKITELLVSNFQSIESSALQLGDLSILVGPGDVGKSAHLRALRALLLNDANDLDIRWNTPYASVVLLFEDETVIEYTKQKGKGGEYAVTVDGGTTNYTKTAGQVPEQVANLLGISEIEVDATTTLTPQLSDQADTPFILWETGSKRARILGKATRLDMVVSAQMACNKTLSSLKQQVKKDTQERDRLEEELASFPDLDDLERRFAEEVDKPLQIITHSEGIVRRGRELAEAMAKVQATAVDTSPVLEKIREIKSQIDQYENVLSTQHSFRALYEGVALATQKHSQASNEAELLKDKVKAAKRKYTKACKEAGVCEVCGGLESHDNCK